MGVYFLLKTCGAALISGMSFTLQHESTVNSSVNWYPLADINLLIDGKPR